MKVSKHQQEYYQQRMNRHGVSPEGAGWKNQNAQENRFSQLVKVFQSSEGFTVNDVGCGFGHLLTYVRSRGFYPDLYRGYDLLPEMVEQAGQVCADDPQAMFECIQDVAQIEPADYCLASGIFTLRGELSEGAWLAYILRTIEEMNIKSRLGFSFNMLTKYSDPEYMQDELYYADPCFFFDFCKRNFSSNVALLHDYQEYDFTLVIRKSGS